MLNFLRLIGLITGYPFQLIFFKRRTFYEDKKNTHLFRGGKLIISNHFSIVDYILEAFIVFPRRLNPITAEFAYENKFFNWGMKYFGCIKANRISKNMKFMDQAAEVIKKGQLVLIFPEARNTPDGKIHEFKHSYLVIAHRAKSPIIPIVTDGEYNIKKRASVIIGKEIDVSRFFDPDKHTPSREELEKANEYVFGKILELREELERRKNNKKGASK